MFLLFLKMLVVSQNDHWGCRAGTGSSLSLCVQARLEDVGRVSRSGALGAAHTPRGWGWGS